MKVIEVMGQVANGLELCGGTVLRQKVELVMFDTKGLDKRGGGC